MMKRLIFMLLLGFFWISEVSAQQIYDIQVANPCTGELETFSASLDERNGTYYALYTYFGQTREFNTDDPNWVTDATNWLLQLVEEQISCGVTTGATSSVDPTTNPSMNMAVNTLQNNLFTMGFNPQTRQSETAGTDASEEGEQGQILKKQELNVGGGVSSYSLDDYSGTASNLGFDYISLLTVGNTQVGLNLNTLSLGGSETDVTNTSILWGLRLKKNEPGAPNELSTEKTMSFNILGGETSDGGGSVVYNSSKKVQNQNGTMTNKGSALSVSFESFNQSSTVIFNMGYAYGMMHGWYFSDKIAGSINGLLVGSFGVHNVITESAEQNDVSLLAGASFGGDLHVFLFPGAALKGSLTFNPKSYVYTYSDHIPDDVYTDSYSTETSGFNGASSFGFNVSFSYRF